MFSINCMRHRVNELAFICWLGMVAPVCAQIPKTPASYPDKLPYAFSNFVWWPDDELRALLKKRIPGLGDQIATTASAEGRVRDALTAILKEKGVAAEIQSEEPSYSAVRQPDMQNMLGMGDLELPPSHPAIVFSILRPQVVVGIVTVQSDAADLTPDLAAELKPEEGKPFVISSLKFSQSRVEELARRRGYLGVTTQFEYKPPRLEGGRYVADVSYLAVAGVRYHISSLTLDGGPLFEGKDLHQFVRAKVGDVAGSSPFAGVGPQLREYYRQQGFADVLVKTDQSLNAERAEATYSLRVIPGPVYHLQSLKIEKLSPEKEKAVREMLEMKPGDVYREAAIQRLYQKIGKEPSFQGMSFGYKPKADKTAALVDLTLEFYSEGGAGKVTVQ